MELRGVEVVLASDGEEKRCWELRGDVGAATDRPRSRLERAAR
jgi:hypothetical protein